MNRKRAYAVPVTLTRHPFPPVFDERSTRLVLGTMPSPASRERRFYYGHPQNRFWPVLAAVFGAAAPVTREERERFALEHGIALWDVLASCGIAGASDASIRAPEANDFSALLAAARVTRVYTTGKKAFDLYRRLCAPKTGIDAVPLPSTSPANRRWSFDALVEAYGCLALPVSP
jgi:hypoxanthine-DNA glycosylase